MVLEKNSADCRLISPTLLRTLSKSTISPGEESTSRPPGARLMRADPKARLSAAPSLKKLT